MIIFKKLTAQNFMSVGNRPVVFDLNSHETTLVVGENGTGKSQCYTDAITYALFNKSFRGINKPNLVNSINEKDCLVEIEFSIGKNDFRVRRGQKPSIFEIYKNGALLDQDANAKDYQTMLEKTILGMNFRSFTQIVILGSASFTPFMQLSPSARREVIEEILEIQIFSVMHTLLKSRIAELKDMQKDVQYRLDLTKEKIKMNAAHQSKLIESLRESNTKIIGRVKDENDQIAEHQTTIAKYTRLINDTTKLLGDMNRVENLRQEYSQYLTQIKRNIKSVDSDITFFTNNTECPTCDQSIGDSFKKKTITSKQSKLSEYRTGLNKLNESIKLLDGDMNEFDAHKQAIKKHEDTISMHRHKIAASEDYITKLESDRKSNIEKIHDYETSAEETDASEILAKELDDYNQNYKTISEDRHYADISYKLLKDTGIKTQIIRQYLPMINKLVNEYLAKLNFFVSFTLDEAFNESIKSRHRDEFSYNSFSEGEKARIDIALLLTWREISRRKNSAACNLLVLDETFDGSLDGDGGDDLMKILRYISNKDNKASSNIVVISHKTDSMIDKFDRVIQVTKQKNFSQYSVTE